MPRKIREQQILDRVGEVEEIPTLCVDQDRYIGVGIEGPDAKQICEAQGKRLLTMGEWQYIVSKELLDIDGDIWEWTYVPFGNPLNNFYIEKRFWFERFFSPGEYSSTYDPRSILFIWLEIFFRGPDNFDPLRYGTRGVSLDEIGFRCVSPQSR